MKVGRFGLGFKSVFHMTGKAKYLPSKPKIKIIIWRFFLSDALSAPKAVQNHGDQQSAMSSLLETTSMSSWQRHYIEVVVHTTYSRLTKVGRWPELSQSCYV